MKKILLATSAIGLLASAQALAGSPSVTIGGYSDFQVGSNDQAGTFDSSKRDTRFRQENEIHISAKGKTDSGLGYGAHIELFADTNFDDDSGASGTTENGNAEKAYLYVESGFGRLELGSNGDAADALRVDASTFARATGGVGGDWYRYVELDNNPGTGSHTAGNGALFYAVPGLPTAMNPDDILSGTYKDRAYANKITYYSPRVEGAQLGVSFTPDQGDKGNNKTNSEYSAAGVLTAPDFENVWNIGLNYQGEIEDIAIEASATAEWGESQAPSAGTASANDDLSAYALGLNLSHAGVTVGGSYASVDEFGHVKTAGTEASYYTLGAAYENGPFGASVTYLSSEIENSAGATLTSTDTELTNLSIGADYQLAPGLVPYVEVSFFETDDGSATTTTDNDGSVFILGTEVSF